LDGFLDIYTKLIIALISFTAPVITFLLSVPFSVLETQMRVAEQFYRTTLLEPVVESFKDKQSSYDFIDNGYRRFFKLLKDVHKKNNLLNAKRQIKRTFIPLLISLTSVMFYKILEEKLQGPKETNVVCLHYIMVSLIAVSLLSFVYALFVIKQIVWAAIDAKKETIPPPSSIIVSDK